MPTPNPLVLVHGYSDAGKSFNHWKQRLVACGYPANLIHIVTYESLTNEVTIKDIAEGFERALRLQAGLSADEDFDAIVHSTGMLVIRSWLTTYAARRSRLKRLIGLAPATFGSPLAHTGRSTLGAIFKGRKELGADFMEAGDEVLQGLELGSRFTWDLAHQDLIGRKPFYGPDADTPYVFVLCGTEAYGGARRLVNQPGTDGTVRLAGAALNTRKISIDLTRPAEDTGVYKRVQLERWSNVALPVYLVPGLNHGSILTEPSDELVERLYSALKVSSPAQFDKWSAQTATRFGAGAATTTRFQQFVVHAVDERGDGIADYNVQLLTDDGNGGRQEVAGFDLDVHVYGRDPSLRCFHVNLDELKPERLKSLYLQVVASARSRMVGYVGFDTSNQPGHMQSASINEITIDITSVLKKKEFTFFFPFTTTLVELTMNREPLPLNQANEVCWFGH